VIGHLNLIFLMAKPSTLNEIDVGRLMENLSNISLFLTRITQKKSFEMISELDILDGETYLSILDSQIPNTNIAEIASRTKEASLISDNSFSLPDLLNCLLIRLQRLKSFVESVVATKSSEVSSSVFIYSI
jgi:hypothetical protein